MQKKSIQAIHSSELWNFTMIPFLTSVPAPAFRILSSPFLGFTQWTVTALFPPVSYIPKKKWEQKISNAQKTSQEAFISTALIVTDLILLSSCPLTAAWSHSFHSWVSAATSIQCRLASLPECYQKSASLVPLHTFSFAYLSLVGPS